MQMAAGPERTPETRASVRLAAVTVLVAVLGGFAALWLAAEAHAPHWVGFAINAAQLAAIGWALVTLIRILRAQGPEGS